ncbi:MAG: phosphoserine phosphatase SerB [Rhodobacteraceae bacterium]|nr:phosphoserine phosphatase SerB [Paracoccaceae bacterium]
MFTATLLTNPTVSVLDPNLVRSLRNAWGGGDVIWLAPGEAAQFTLAAMPDNRWQIWDDLQGMQVDLVIQTTTGRRKAILLADMDSTMIEQECIDELADAAGIGEFVKGITARAMNAELDFEAALIERVELLRGLDEGVVAQVLETRITLMPGAGELLATMKANGAYAALVSGGFTAFTAHVAGVLEFDEHRANWLEIKAGKLTGGIGRPILGRDAKVQALNEIAVRLGLTSDDVMAVGDGANDLGMLGLAGAGVALHAKPAVARECDIRINFGDLSALLFIQGYRREEFVVPPRVSG